MVAESCDASSLAFWSGGSPNAALEASVPATPCRVAYGIERCAVHQGAQFVELFL